MEEIKNLRTKQINEFISSFADIRNVTVDEIKTGLHTILGETPAVDFEYGVDFTLNETTGDEDRKDSLKNIHIYYSYIDDNNITKIGKMKFLVG